MIILASNIQGTVQKCMPVDSSWYEYDKSSILVYYKHKPIKWTYLKTNFLTILWKIRIFSLQKLVILGGVRNDGHEH